MRMVTDPLPTIMLCLPSIPVFAFQMLLRSVPGDGSCSVVLVIVVWAGLLLCTASCIFPRFIDSFRGIDGKVHYGVITPWGLYPFRAGHDVSTEDRYRLRFVDILHAAMSALVFISIALSDHLVRRQGRSLVGAMVGLAMAPPALHKSSLDEYSATVRRCLIPGKRRRQMVKMAAENFPPLVVGAVCSVIFLVSIPPSPRYGIDGVSKSSMLANFLPTGTILAFKTILPVVSDGDSCSTLRVVLLWTLLLSCAVCCCCSHFIDSFRASDGQVYYGLVRKRGLSLLRTGLGVEVPRDDRYRRRCRDFVHAVLAVLIFAAVALADHRVYGCLIPGHSKKIHKVMENFPQLLVGAVCSVFFQMFPNLRCGIGCFLAPTP
ncbi:hypothetical protein EJB05_45564, partial [Eragrostis curvula]